MKRHVRSVVVTAVLIFSIALPGLAAPLSYPIRHQEGFPIDTEPPAVSAASWILYDASSDMVLAEWDADTSRPMASITKIMTVMLALENGDLNSEVTVSEEAAGQGGQEIGLVAGETVTLGALVRAAMVRSGNDSAAAIAEAIGGSIDGFVKMMNDRAAELGMVNTHYANPNGLDTPGHYSSARDMLTLARQAMTIPEFRDLVRSRVMVFPDTPDGRQRGATNTNRILDSYPGAIGVKTGETPHAGLTYVGAAERNGRRLYVVLLHSVGRRAHFSDAIKLYNWAFYKLAIQGMITVGAPYQSLVAGAPSPAPTAQVVVGNPASNVASPPAWRPALDSPGASPQPGGQLVDVTRVPDPAPQSVLSSVTYWFGLITGAFSG